MLIARETGFWKMLLRGVPMVFLVSKSLIHHQLLYHIPTLLLSLDELVAANANQGVLAICNICKSP